MTVKELKEALATFPDDQDVVLPCDRDQVYFGILDEVLPVFFAPAAYQSNVFSLEENLEDVLDAAPDARRALVL